MKFKGQRDFYPWVLNGHKIKGNYLGDYPIVGIVKDSRVCYGGIVKHWVELDKPIFVNFSDEPMRKHVYILEHWDETENELEEIIE